MRGQVPFSLEQGDVSMRETTQYAPRPLRVDGYALVRRQSVFTSGFRMGLYA